MKQVNLVPVAVRAKEGRERLIFSVTIAVILAAGAVTFMRVAANTQAEIAADNLRSLRSGDALLTGNVAVAEPNVARRVEQLNGMAKTDIDWSRAFSLVGDVLPKDIVLTSYSYIQNTGVMTLKLNGEAPSNLSYATFDAAMRADKARFSLTKTDSYGFDPVKGSVTFAMTLTVKPDQLTYVETK